MSHQWFLITTAWEDSWRLDETVVFLGEWCRLYYRKTKWKELDTIVGAVYGWKDGQQEDDYKSCVWNYFVWSMLHTKWLSWNYSFICPLYTKIRMESGRSVETKKFWLLMSLWTTCSLEYCVKNLWKTHYMILSSIEGCSLETIHCRFSVNWYLKIKDFWSLQPMKEVGEVMNLFFSWANGACWIVGKNHGSHSTIGFYRAMVLVQKPK